MARRIDLNADVGEASEVDGVAIELALLELVTTVHVACGFHAGDPDSMRRLVGASRRHGVTLGAHPSYPDRTNFGRLPMERSPGTVAQDVTTQVSALRDIADAAGVAVCSVKPHGALYHRLAQDAECLDAVIEALCGFEPVPMLVLPAGTPSVAHAVDAGMGVAREGFCDRGYRADGVLAARDTAGALLTDPDAAARQARLLACDAQVHTLEKTVLTLACDTLCIHGDTPGARGIAAAVRAELTSAGVTISVRDRGPVNETWHLVAHLFGDTAVLIDVESPGQARSLATRISGDLAASLRDAIEDVVPTRHSVLIVFDPARIDGTRLIDALSAHPGTPLGETDAPRRADRHEIPFDLDGPDIGEVCAALEIDTETLARLLAERDLVVEMIGFAPGFAYLGNLPSPLDRVERRSAPRTAVPKGAVALAGGFAAIYPGASPGGWQLIGHSDVEMFDPTTPPYARLAAGDRVHLTPRAASGASRASHDPRPGPRRAPRGVQPIFEVLDPGSATRTQDGGRIGMAHLGIPRAGPADPRAHVLANLLVGNPPGAPALETTLRGPVLRCLADTYVAMVGPGSQLDVNGHLVDAGQVLPVTAGQELNLRSALSGLRSYLAVAGGIGGDRFFGSLSSDQLTGLGGGPLQSGDQLWTTASRGLLRDHLDPSADRTDNTPSDDSTQRPIRMLPGPHPDWFPDEVIDRCRDTSWKVSSQSDRVGTRLQTASGPGITRRAGEIQPIGVVTGAVQVPPDGNPVILGPDHATTGGYPILGVVIAADLGVLGQCRPGDRVQLVPVTIDDALQARDQLARRLSAACVGHYPVAAG